MCGVCDVCAKDLGKCFKEMKREGFHKTVVGGAGGRHHSAGAEEEHVDEMASYLARWGNHLRLPLPLIELAKTIAANTQHVLTKGSDPSSVCGAALYVAGYCGALHDRRTYEGQQQAAASATRASAFCCVSQVTHALCLRCLLVLFVLQPSSRSVASRLRRCAASC